MRRLRISTRMISAMALLLVLLGALAIVALSAISAQRRATETVSAYRDTTRLAMQIKFRAADFNGWQTAYAFDAVRGIADAAAPTGAGRRSFLASAQSFRTEADALRRTGRLSDAEQHQLAAAMSRFDQFMSLDNQVAAGYTSHTTAGSTAAGKLVAGAEIDLFNEIARDVDALVASVDTAADHAVTTAQTASRRSTAVIIAVAVVAVLVGVVLAVVLIRSIIPPLTALNRRLAEIADGDGDLTQRISDHTQDELAETAAGFNRFADRMQRLVSDVAARASEVANAAGELRTVSVELAEGAADTSSQAAVVSSSAEEVSAIVSTMAASAEQMNASIVEISRSANQASAVVESSLQASQSATETITRLGAASDQPARASPWSPARSKTWPSRPRPPPIRSPSRSRRSAPAATTRCGRSARSAMW
jgi:methyl-accepting chemotaxis protein